MPRLKTALCIVLALAAAISASVAIRQRRAAREEAETAARLGKDMQSLKTQFDEVTRQRDALLQAHIAQVPPAPDQQPALPDKQLQARAIADALAIKQLQENLDAARAAGSKLEERVSELEGELQNITEENKRRSASQIELGEKIAGLNRVIDAMEAETKSRNDRLVQLELVNKQLRDESTASSQRTTDAARAASELQELYRRREVHMTSILNR